MQNGKLKVIILAQYALVVNGLKHKLEERFNSDLLQITPVYDIRTCMKLVHEGTDIVVMDYFIDGYNYKVVGRELRKISKDLHIVMHSSREDVIASIHAYLNGGVESRPVKKYSNKLQAQYI